MKTKLAIFNLRELAGTVGRLWQVNPPGCWIFFCDQFKPTELLLLKWWAYISADLMVCHLFNFPELK